MSNIIFEWPALAFLMADGMRLVASYVEAITAWPLPALSAGLTREALIRALAILLRVSATRRRSPKSELRQGIASCSQYDGTACGMDRVKR
mgnify:CR=1 FL=1